MLPYYPSSKSSKSLNHVSSSVYQKCWLFSHGLILPAFLNWSSLFRLWLSEPVGWFGLNAFYGSMSYFCPPLLGAKILILGFDSQAINFNNTFQLLILRFHLRMPFLFCFLAKQKSGSKKGFKWYFDAFNMSLKGNNRNKNYLRLNKKGKWKIRTAKFWNSTTILHIKKENHLFCISMKWQM